MKFIKIILFIFIAQTSLLNAIISSDKEDLIWTMVCLCPALKQVDSVESLEAAAQRFAKTLDESGINPFKKNENGETLVQIAERNYRETQKPVCKMVFDELKKYEERYVQKQLKI